MKSKAKNKDIYITDISFDANEEDLRKLFAVCGKVHSVRLLNDERTDKFTGRAFVRMSTTEEAHEAVNMLDGTRLIDRCITVKAARDKVTPLAAEAVKPAKPRRVRQRPKRTRQ